MLLEDTRARAYLRDFDLTSLFVEELGWDRHNARLEVPVGDQSFTLTAVAEKRGMVAYICGPTSDGRIPDYSTRRKIERQVARSVHEHLIIFVDGDKSGQVWQWVKLEAGKPLACREHAYHRGHTGEALIQKLRLLAVSLGEEESLTILDMARRARAAFDVERVTKRFYDRFKTEHTAFLRFIRGISAEADRAWYASLMLNRLMFIYFIQKKGFLDGDVDYLRHRLQAMRARQGFDRFLSFYRHFLLRLFHEGLGQQERSSELDALLGSVPYLNGGLFDVHQLEAANPDIQIPDEAFERIFDFFDAYQWHLDERPLRADNEINPDVLGYIFEKYINQKQMGAYYTKEDITEYIGKNTVIPFLFDAARQACRIAFEGEQSIWRLLQADPDRYIYPAVRKGVDIALPEEIAAGLNDVSKRTGWNRPADAELALPSETWREHVARRKRCLDLRAKLAAGEIRRIDDFITYNLDIRQFAEDVIENCEGPELLRAFYHAIEKVTVLDPTCGSGAFLFAALNILEPLYEACLDRMQVFLDDLDRSGEKHRPEKFSDFRTLLERVAKHPNRRYFILKSIIVNNLYGVDIMEEAVEICKLRLFLKLVAQVESVQEIEPLPDVDFNIRAGNTLVGFVSLDDVRNAITMTKNSYGQIQVRMLDQNDTEVLRTIDERAELADSAFQTFHQMQIHYGMDAAEFGRSKRAVRAQLKALEDELNRYLATDCGVDLRKKASYDKWLVSHQPFHWFLEFYGIFKDGGFDVVIGNPPYAELRSITAYSIRGFTTLATKNLYPLVIERSMSFSSSSGRLGFIVPMSSISTEGFRSLQEIILQHPSHFSSFDDRPSRLFDGLEHIRLSIHLIKNSPAGEQSCFSAASLRWSATERGHLFSRIQYRALEPAYLPGCVPKLSGATEISILNKVWRDSKSVGEQQSSGGTHVVYYSRKLAGFLQVLDFVPEVYDGQGKLRPPSEFKALRFSDAEKANVVFCALNSSLFRWFINVFSDYRHVNKREVEGFRLDLAKSLQKGIERWSNLAQKLSDGLRSTSEFRQMRFGHDTLQVQCIIPKRSKQVIDEIDSVLAQHYGFADDELDFIVNHDIKYRMGLESDEGNDE